MAYHVGDLIIEQLQFIKPIIITSFYLDQYLGLVNMIKLITNFYQLMTLSINLLKITEEKKKLSV